jgi:hypothetical protein
MTSVIDPNDTKETDIPNVTKKILVNCNYFRLKAKDLRDVRN